jgi:DNA repair protein RadA/Sms
VKFVCGNCAAVFPKWEGRCSACGEWNSLEEAVERAVAPRERRDRSAAVKPARMSEVSASAAERMSTGFTEVDRVLGGGICEGSLILLGGDPGIGKSTLALQLAKSCGGIDSPTLYCAGEESATQLAGRAKRLGCADADIEVIVETGIDTIVATIDSRRPGLAIVDSIQTTYDGAVAGVPGSPSQVREAVGRLMACAKQTGVPIVLIGHVTKEGAIAGPRTLEHMVDVVLYLEGDRHGDNRILRGVKNRFGATGEAGLLVMTETGMQQLDPGSRAFFEEASLGVAGNVLTIVCEGSRAFAVEVQALAVSTQMVMPRRTASGFDLGRLHVLLAVLEKRCKLKFGEREVYTNVVGGIRVTEPAADLAVAMALVSTMTNKPLPQGAAVLGEVGLGGEVRRVRQEGYRLAEAAAVGIERVVLPAGGSRRSVPTGVRVIEVSSLQQAVAMLNRG